MKAYSPEIQRLIRQLTYPPSATATNRVQLGIGLRLAQRLARLARAVPSVRSGQGARRSALLALDMGTARTQAWIERDRKAARAALPGKPGPIRVELWLTKSVGHAVHAIANELNCSLERAVALVLSQGCEEITGWVEQLADEATREPRRISRSEQLHIAKELADFYRSLHGAASPQAVFPPEDFEEVLESQNLVAMPSTMGGNLPKWHSRAILREAELCVSADEAAVLFATQEFLRSDARVVCTLTVQNIETELEFEGLILDDERVMVAMEHLEARRLAVRVPGRRAWLCTRLDVA